jgi:chromosome segregation ATPase
MKYNISTVWLIAFNAIMPAMCSPVTKSPVNHANIAKALVATNAIALGALIASSSKNKASVKELTEVKEDAERKAYITQAALADRDSKKEKKFIMEQEAIRKENDLLHKEIYQLTREREKLKTEIEEWRKEWEDLKEDNEYMEDERAQENERAENAERQLEKAQDLADRAVQKCLELNEKLKIAEGRGDETD